MLHEDGSRGRSADRGLGLHALSQQTRAVQLRLHDNNNRAQLARSRAHLLRMRASDDTSIAQSDLDKVMNLDQQLADIREQATTSRKGFGAASTVIVASGKAKQQLMEEATRVASQVKNLRAKITKLVSESHADKTKAAEDNDEEDQEQEDLSSALVRRNRREKRVLEQRRRLDRLQLKYQKADKVAASKLTQMHADLTEATTQVKELQSKFKDAPKDAPRKVRPHKPVKRH